MKSAEIARDYLAALERGDAGDDLRRFFTDDFVQIEYPNALNPKGQRSDLATTLERSLRGRGIMRRQRYEIENMIVDGDHVALEVKWVGVLAITIAGIPAGGEMHAHFGVFLDIRDGRIARQRNYDCFEPLTTPVAAG